MSEFNPRSVKSLIGWAFALIFSLVFLFGPHIAILVYVAEPQTWMFTTYWMCMATYLMAAYVIDVSPDTSNLGLGGTMINNPFSFEDDHNRAMLKIALFVWPGKVIWWTLGRTWRVIRGV
ncbi:MAG: hypothetical protein KTR15_01905 [Phycisphaeraceae bacterium]|nr:hypothetical protein [Phycisphaeraceae bacterium]